MLNRSLRNLMGGICLATFTLYCCGCDTGIIPRTAMVQVAGEVSLDDEPLGEARIVFVPENADPSDFEISYGVSDSEGKFSLRTASGREGAIAGRHRVLISHADFRALEKTTIFRPEDFFREADHYDTSENWKVLRQKIDLAKGEQVPFYYNMHSELTCELVAGKNAPVRFNLQSLDPMLKKQATSQNRD